MSAFQLCCGLGFSFHPCETSTRLQISYLTTVYCERAYSRSKYKSCFT